MGRGLSKLQKWIILKIGHNKTLDSETALIEFYGFEKRIYPPSHTDDTWCYAWLKNGEDVLRGGIYNLSTKPVSYSGDLENSRSAFYHSAQKLIKRGLINGSVKYGLGLTPSGLKKFIHLSINDNLRLTDRPKTSLPTYARVTRIRSIKTLSLMKRECARIGGKTAKIGVRSG